MASPYLIKEFWRRFFSFTQEKVLNPEPRSWRKVFFLQTLFEAKSYGPFGVQVQLVTRKSVLVANRYIGTIFMTVPAVKYRRLIQTGSVHFLHSLVRAKEDAKKVAAQTEHLWNVNALHTFFL